MSHPDDAKLKDLIDKLGLGKEVEASNATGRRFAAVIGIVAQENDIDSPSLAHALAVVLAGMLVSADSHMTYFEAEGHGLLDDSKRIELFIEDVKDIAADMRKMRGAAKGEGVQ